MQQCELNLRQIDIEYLLLTDRYQKLESTSKYMSKSECDGKKINCSFG